jgi:putative addiction module CopG family antidote
MEIHLRPELEKLIEEDVQRGPYQNMDEFVERAVSLLHEQEATTLAAKRWLQPIGVAAGTTFG